MLKVKFSEKAKAYDLPDDGEKPNGCVRTACTVKSYRTLAGGLEVREIREPERTDQSTPKRLSRQWDRGCE